MELEDSLYPLLREVNLGTDPYEVFRDADWALLIGAKPRGPGMERADLLDINGQIFAEQVHTYIHTYTHTHLYIYAWKHTCIDGLSPFDAWMCNITDYSPFPFFLFPGKSSQCCSQPECQGHRSWKPL
jgi:hypothetical protein